jgi:hypothetical protein
MGGIVVIANFFDDRGRGRYGEFINQRGIDRIFVAGKRATYVPEVRMWVVGAQEIQAKDGHLLAIGTKYGSIVKTTETRDAISAAKDLGGILGPVHLFYKWGMGPYLLNNPDLWSEFAFFEGKNGSAELHIPFVFPKDSNDKSLDFYFDKILPNPKLNAGITYSSDAHSVRATGTSWTGLPDYTLSNLIFNDAFFEYLGPAIRSVKTTENSHMEPNIDDALEHMVKASIGKVRNKLNKIIGG